MPTYDYQCENCNHTWELFQKITDDPVKKCPSCGKRKANRLFGTGAAIMFKGSGFYETDYRSDSYKKSAEAEKKSAESGSESKSDSAKTAASERSTDSKPAATSKSSETKANKKKD
jgi:putative FmdB family regulatory protein